MIQKTQLKEYLLSNLSNARTGSGGKEIICQCQLPGCSDTKQHLYIGPFDDSDKPIVYNCFKCNSSGIVNKDFLEQYGVSFNDINNELLESNKGSPYKCKGIDNDLYYNIKYTNITDSNLSRMKLGYINNRLGTNFTYKDCIDNKIVLNLLDILNENRITKYTRDQKIIEQLNGAFIGFLSRANDSLNMRNLAQGKVHSSIDMKYINYKIFNVTANNDYYILPTSFDLGKKVKIYIAEGAMDILSIKYNVMCDFENSIYVAGKGKAYRNSLIYLIQTYGLTNLDIHFFPDKDVQDYIIKDISKLFAPFGYTFYMHRNGYNGEKDFGVPKDKISDICVRI